MRGETSAGSLESSVYVHVLFWGTVELDDHSEMTTNVCLSTSDQQVSLAQLRARVLVGNKADLEENRKVQSPSREVNLKSAQPRRDG